MPNYARKEAVEAFIGRILDAIEQEDREPDDWEAHDIAAALGYVVGHMHYAAINVALRALTEPENRAPMNLPMENPAATGTQLRDALEYVSGMPARAG